MCNDGRITGRSINTTSDSESGIDYYISQLNVQIVMNDNLDGKTVECAHILNHQTTLIGTHTIVACTTGRSNI